MESNLLNISEAAKYLKVSKSFIYRATNRGDIKVVRVSARKILIRVESLENYINQKTTGGIKNV